MLFAVSKFFGSIYLDYNRARAHTKPRLSPFPQPSRTTSVGFLSSRRARKTGARNFPSRVHSANLIWATNFGFTQSIFFIMEGVIPCTHCPFCFEGRSTNGQAYRASCWSFLYNIDNDFVVNPVPTFPAKTSLFLS